jgi:hypothetical protein
MKSSMKVKRSCLAPINTNPSFASKFLSQAHAQVSEQGLIVIVIVAFPTVVVLFEELVEVLVAEVVELLAAPVPVLVALLLALEEFETGNKVSLVKPPLRGPAGVWQSVP